MSTPNTPTPTHTDAELIALAALVNIEAVLMAGDNQQRALNGESPAWREGCGFMPATNELQQSLYKKGIQNMNTPTPSKTPETDAAIIGWTAHSATALHGPCVVADFARKLEQGRDAVREECERMSKRLQIDPGGSDKIDELEQAAQFLRAELTKARELIGWIDCNSRMPDGWERKVFAWIVWPDGCGWRDQPEAVVAWWKHGPACFAYEDVEHANHLVKYWMEIPSLPNTEISHDRNGE